MKYFRYPFAVSGDRDPINDESNVDGTVSYQAGYTAPYSIDAELDPINSKLVERTLQNQLYFAITDTLKIWQERMFPDYITPTDNGGSAYSYPENSIVSYGGVLKINTVDGNTDDPDQSTWVDLFPLAPKFGGTGFDNLNDLFATLNLGTISEYDYGTGDFEVATNLDNANKFLQIANDLSDVLDPATARTNLGLGSIATINSSIFTDSLLPLSDAQSWRNALSVPEVNSSIRTGDLIKSSDTDISTRGFLAASGQEASRTIYASLFSVIGERFGIGDGSTTFNLPDENNGVVPLPPTTWTQYPFSGYGDEIGFTYYGVTSRSDTGDIYSINTQATPNTIELLTFGGSTWSDVVTTGLPSGDLDRGIAISSLTGDLYVCDGEDPYTLASGGGSWSALTTTGLPASRGNATRILYDSLNDRIYVKFFNYDELYWLAADGTGSWSSVTVTGIPVTGPPIDYAIDDTGALYVVIAAEPVVYKLAFGGGSFAALTDFGLPEVGTARFSVDSATGIIALIVGSDIYTLDQSETRWVIATTTNRENPPVEIHIDPFSSKILASGTAPGNKLESLTYNGTIGKTFYYIKA